MSDKNHKPQNHKAPHDASEAQPGLDALAPDDQSWRPTPHPTAPGEEPSAPGSLKAPDIHSSKLDALAQQRKDSENVPLTTNQGVRIADDQNSLRAGTGDPRCWKTLFCVKKLLTLTMSGSRSASSMRADRRRTAIFNPTAT